MLRLVLWKYWFPNSNVVVKAKQACPCEGERDDAAIAMHGECRYVFVGTFEDEQYLCKVSMPFRSTKDWCFFLTLFVVSAT